MTVKIRMNDVRNTTENLIILPAIKENLAHVMCATYTMHRNNITAG